MKRILSLLLMIFLLSGLCACGGKTGPGPDSGKEPEKPEIDFCEMNFVILEEAGRAGLFYRNNTANSDYIIDRIHSMEESYNCTIEVSNKYGDDIKLMEAVSKAGAIGSSIGDMAYTINSNMASVWAKAGLLVPFSEVSDVLDYEHESEKYGSTSLFEIAMYNSEVYQVYPVALPDYITSLYANCLFAVNEMLIKENNLTDPREDVEKGIWNWDTFEQRLSDFTLGAGNEKIYATRFERYYFLINAALSNGVRYITTVDGQPASGVAPDKTAEAIDWVKKILTDKKDTLVCTTNGYWRTSRSGEFFEGRAVLGLMDTDAVSSSVAVSDTVKDFGVVPFPCGPSGEYGNWSCELVSARGMSMMLSSDMEAEDRAVIISGLFEPFDEYQTKEDLAEALLQSTYFDKRDVDLMLNLYKGGQYFYWTVEGRRFWDSADDHLMSQSGSQIMEAYSKQMDKPIQDYILPNYDYISTH